MEVNLNNTSIGGSQVSFGTPVAEPQAKSANLAGEATQTLAGKANGPALSALGFADSLDSPDNIQNAHIDPSTDEAKSHVPGNELRETGLKNVARGRSKSLAETPSSKMVPEEGLGKLGRTRSKSMGDIGSTRRASLGDAALKFDELEGKHDISNKSWAASSIASGTATVVSKAAKTSKSAKATGGLAAGSAILDGVASIAGTAATGVSFFKKLKLNNEVKKLEKELKTATDPDVKANIEKQITEKKGQIGTSAKSLGFSLLANLCWNVSSAVNTAATFGAKIGSKLVNGLCAGFGGIAYGVISAGVKIAGIWKDFKEIRSVNKEIRMCNEKLKDPNVSPELKEIYGARKLTLETKVKENVKLNRMKNFVDLGCSVLSAVQGVLALTFAAAAPWLAIPLAVGIGASVGIKMYMDKKSANADKKIEQALQQSVATADFNHSGPDKVPKEFAKLTPNAATGAPRMSDDKLAEKAMSNNDPGMKELQAVVAKEIGLSDPSKVSAQDIAAWTRKTPAPSGETAGQGAPLMAKA